MKFREYIIWISIFDSLEKIPILTREFNKNQISYYLFDRVKIFTHYTNAKNNNFDSKNT